VGRGIADERLQVVMGTHRYAVFPGWNRVPLVLCQPCSAVFMADLLPCGMTVEGGDGEAVPGDVDGGGA
jgi:hypothetical protein